MQAIRVERQIGGRSLSIETGTYAKLADGSVTVRYGDSVVFGAVVRANPREGIDFFPLRWITASAVPPRANSPAGS
jgi:polyribonucleotide nucleotidyltransferase